MNIQSTDKCVKSVVPKSTKSAGQPMCPRCYALGTWSPDSEDVLCESCGEWFRLEVVQQCSAHAFIGWEWMYRHQADAKFCKFGPVRRSISDAQIAASQLGFPASGPRQSISRGVTLEDLIRKHRMRSRGNCDQIDEQSPKPEDFEVQS